MRLQFRLHWLHTFGYAIAFTVADNRIPKETYPANLSPTFYLAAGTQEPEFLSTTAGNAADLQPLGINHRFIERNASHGTSFWAAEWPIALS